MKSQKKLIEKGDWDNLIILDACRYDFFKKLSNKLGLEGNLQKVWSPASNSHGWCTKVLDSNSFKDTIVLSANPYLNSRTKARYFDARGKFKKIYDVWDYGWSGKIGTVYPETMSKEVVKVKRKFSDSRLMVWYMQPHQPYLSLKISRETKKRGPKSIGKVKKPFRRAIHLMGNVLDRYVSLYLSKVYRRMIITITQNPQIISSINRIYSLEGKQRLQELYEKNLERALLSVSGILGDLNGKTVITADHGELLGEKGLGHWEGSSRPLLHEVPWFEVEK